jgi:N-acetyl-anhydromuramyl-L-alanine amidase AmpD
MDECAFHAGPVNDVSIGIEIYQGRDAEMYADQLAAVVRLAELHIQTGAPLDIDGIPGGDTRRALDAAGRSHGQWVPRPGD